MDKFHEKPWLIKTDLYIKCEQSWITKRNWAYNLKPLGSEGLIRKSTDISISVIFYSFKNHYSKGIIFPVCVCITYCYLPVLTFYHLDVVCVCVCMCTCVCMYNLSLFTCCCCCSVAQLCPTLCDPNGL